MESPAELLMVPVNAVGILAMQRTKVNKTRAPHLSQRGPKTKRIMMVPPTPTILEVHNCCLVRPRVTLISLSKGAMANQMKKAIKKPHQEQWKALMWGRAKLQSLISL